MKTKFSQFVKVKQQILREIENKLTKLNLKIAAVESTIHSILLQIMEVKVPNSGSMQEFVRAGVFKEALQHELHEAREERQLLETEKEALRLRLKEAHLEFEKAKHLEEIEIERLLKLKRQLEEKEMNELAIQLHNSALRTGFA